MLINNCEALRAPCFLLSLLFSAEAKGEELVGEPVRLK